MMTFRQLTEHQRTLRARAGELEKQAILKLVGAPFRLAGKAIGAPAKAAVGSMYQSSKRFGGPVLGPLMFGAGVLGTAGAAGAALGKTREYSRGFDPRIQELKLQGHRF